jgi:hypothetical protein
MKTKDNNRNRRKVVIDVVTGNEYIGTAAAAKSIGMKQSTLKQKLRGFVTNNTNLFYKEKQEND